MNYKDLHPKNGEPQRLFCTNCKESMKLIFDNFQEKVEDIEIKVEGLPYLQCPKCGGKNLPDHSKIALIRIFEETSKRGEKEFQCKRRKNNQGFNFGKVDFIYDSDDYFYIPGLVRDNKDGFLTPVFFNKSVLIKFYNWPGYNIHFASRTYGTINKGDDYSIPFGINRNDKVIMWLGDISELPEDEQHYLRSENVNSDHDLGSEFYDGQIEAEFTKRTPEDELIQAWSNMHNTFLKKFGEKSSHLDEESLKLIKYIIRPAVFTEKEAKNIIDNLNKLCNETINSNNLETLLKAAGENPEKLRSLKRLQLLLEHYFPSENIADLLLPFFVLYDLRTSFLHLTSRESQKETIKEASSRLGITKKVNFEILYDELIKQMITAYKSLTKILE